jgi:3-oxoadipate enol-lactonase
VPFVENQGAKIYWDEQGSGEPLLLIMGLSYASNMWHRSRPFLAERFRTIAFDNRGVGQSDVPEGIYPIATMASDAAAVLDAAGVETAHVFGVSMGGMIAQEFAINYPQRVRSLILGCTAPGRSHSVPTPPDALQTLTRQGLTPAEAREAIIPFIYDPETPCALIDEDTTFRMKWFPTTQGYLGQLQGIISWDCYDRLPQITAPTLIIHGETDKLVPVGNAQLIADRIPGAEVVLLPNASHIFETDQPTAARGAIMRFLEARCIPA